MNEKCIAISQALNNALLKAPHDLRGPIVNIHGFAGELEIAIAELTTLFEQHRDVLPADFRAASTAIVQDDLTPCLEFLKQANQQLDNRIDDLAHRIAADQSDTEANDA